MSFDQNTRQRRHSLSKGEGCTGEYLYYLSIFIHSSSKGEPSSKLVHKITNCPRRTLEKPWSGTCKAPAAFRPVQPAMHPASFAEDICLRTIDSTVNGQRRISSYRLCNELPVRKQMSMRKRKELESKTYENQTLIDDASSVHPDYPRLVDLSLGRVMFRKYKSNIPWVVAQLAITRRHISAGALLRKFVVPF